MDLLEQYNAEKDSLKYAPKTIPVSRQAGILHASRASTWRAALTHL